MAAQPRILFLYTELAGYFLACCAELVRQGAEVHIVRRPVNKEAPFEFEFGESIRIYERSDYDHAGLLALAEKISPGAIVCSGWIDKDYVKVCSAWKKRSTTILALDNKWLGTGKQQLARIISRFAILPLFDFCWVPGRLQKEYAMKLGFPETRIRSGFYSADTAFFREQYEAHREQKRKKFPHRFVYAGRYYDFKGVEDLWTAFMQLKEDRSNDWELWCLGTGDIEPVAHPAIRHFGFVQPAQMPEILAGAGVFVMPSRVEPWGVVLQEFAAAGFPLLCSDKVGALHAFVQEGENGFVFPAGNSSAIEKALSKITAKSDEELFAMGERSAAIALAVSPQKWTETLLGMVKSTK